MLILRLVAVRAVDADPSRLVALRRPSCGLVDNSFSLLSQAGITLRVRSGLLYLSTRLLYDPWIVPGVPDPGIKPAPMTSCNLA